MGRLIVLIPLLTLLACDTSTDGPAGFPANPCNTTYFNEQMAAGFSPPGNLVGPIGDGGPSGTGQPIVVEWRLPDEARAQFRLSIFEFDGSMEEVVALHLKLVDPTRYDVTRNEAIMLNSGLLGWLIVEEALDPSNDEIFASVYVVRGNVHARASGYGSATPGTGDLDTLLAVFQTLCLK